MNKINEIIELDNKNKRLSEIKSIINKIKKSIRLNKKFIKINESDSSLEIYNIKLKDYINKLEIEKLELESQIISIKKLILSISEREKLELDLEIKKYYRSEKEKKYIKHAYQSMIINIDNKEIIDKNEFVDIFRFLNKIGIFITTYETYELFKNSFDKYIIKDILDSIKTNNENCLNLLINNNYLNKEEVSDFLLFLEDCLNINKKIYKND